MKLMCECLCLISQKYYYRLPTKLQEGNVFTSVCDSFGGGGSTVTITHDALNLAVQALVCSGPSPYPTSDIWTGLDYSDLFTGGSPTNDIRDLSKLVHLRTLWGGGEYVQGMGMSGWDGYVQGGCVSTPSGHGTDWVGGYWHLVAAIRRMVGKWSLRILLECFLV